MTVETPTPAATRRRALIILAAVAGTLVVAMLLLLGGGDEDPDDLAVPTPTVTGTTTPTPTAKPTNEPPETDEAFEGRDPFEAFISEPVAPPPGPGGTPQPTPTSTGTVDDGDGGDTTVISLIDIFTRDGERMASIEVDGEQFTVVAGETVNGNLKVLTIQRRCASFQFGDERFELCLGQEVRK